MKPPPPRWPRISSSLVYADAAAAIDWLCKAFGFTVRIRIDGEGGTVEHSELDFGDGLIMVAGTKAKFPHRKSPSELAGANTQNLFVYVDDVEAHFERAKTAGATIVRAPSIADYGDGYWKDKGYECIDIGGHHWWFSERLETRY